MTRVLVTGARTEGRYTGGEERMVEAVLLVLDWESGEIVHEDRYVPDPSVLPPEGGRTGYRSAHVDARRGVVVVPAFTEVIEYDLAGWSRRVRLTHPTFHDLHHALLLDDGGLLVVNTGLERLQWFDADGEIVREVEVIDTKGRFAENGKDWRRVDSTKPHEAHVNHAVVLDGRVWATRFFQRDLIDPRSGETRVSDLPGGPHDGKLTDAGLTFTTTDGALHLYDPRTGAHRRTVRLSAARDQQGGVLGWCRGVSISGDRALVGFSCFRRSKWQRVYAPWIKHGRVYRPSRVVEYDLENERVVREFVFEDDLTAMSVFTVEVLPD